MHTLSSASGGTCALAASGRPGPYRCSLPVAAPTEAAPTVPDCALSNLALALGTDANLQHLQLSTGSSLGLTVAASSQVVAHHPACTSHLGAYPQAPFNLSALLTELERSTGAGVDPQRLQPARQSPSAHNKSA